MSSDAPRDPVPAAPGDDRPAQPYEEQFLAGVIDALADPVFVKDEQHRWSALNQAFCRFMGYPREALLGRSDFDFFPRDEAEVFWARDDAVFRKGGEDVNEEFFTDAAGIRHVIVTKKTTFVDAWGRTWLVGVIRDVSELRLAQEELLAHRERLEELVRQRTAELSEANARLRLEIAERQRAEEERLRLELQMQQVQKLESLGVLAGGIAHDFNNLLAGMLGNADLALAELPPGAPGRAFVEEARRAALRSASLTNQMLAYSGRGRFQVEVVDLNALVDDLASLVRASTPKKVGIRLAFGEDLPPVEVDVAQVRQVVMNLITNAAEAIGEDVGAVTVRTAAVDHPGGPLAGAAIEDDLPAGRYVRLEVTDDGRGMDEETRSRIFEPFFTTKATGRGLGLAAVLGIVRGHRGALAVRSVPGVGSTFRVLLPATRRPVAPAEERQPAPPPAWRSGARVLVVDDEEMLRRMLRTMLEGAGLDVTVAADGREAIRVFREQPDRFGVVLLDLTMPEMGGVEALEALRAIRPDVRVILTSGYSEMDVSRGTDDFLGKPFTLATLLAKVRRALEVPP